MKKKIKNIINNLKLRPRLMVFFILTASLPILISSTFSFSFFNSFIEKTSKQNIEDKLHTALLLYDKKKNDIEKICRTTSDDNIIILNLELLLYQPISNHLNKIIKSSNLSFLSIVDDNGKLIVSGNRNYFITSDKPVIDSLILEKAVKQKQNTFISRDFSEEFFKNERIINDNKLDHTTIISVFPVYSYSKNFLGYIIAGYLLSNDNKIKKSSISLIDEIKKNVSTNVIIIDNKKPIAYSEGNIKNYTFHYPDDFYFNGDLNLENFYDIRVNNKYYLFKFSPVSNNSKFKIYVGIGVLFQSYLAERNKAVFLIIITTFMVLIIVVIISYILSNQITSPILSMIDGTQNVIDGSYKKKININTNDEIKVLGNSFNIMIDEIKKRIEMDKFVSDMSRKFINLPINLTSKEIFKSIDEISSYVFSDKTNIYFVDDNLEKFILFYSCKRKGIASSKNIKELKIKNFPWLFEQIYTSESMHILSIKDLPEEAINEKNKWLFQKIKSIIIVPMFYGKKLRGLLSFEFIKKADHTTDEDIRLIRMFAEIICNTLERQKAENAITSTKNYLRNLFNAQSSILISINPEGVITQWNNSAENFTGISNKKSISHKIWKIIPFLNNYKNYIQKVIETSNPVDLHREQIMYNGKKYIDISFLPLAERKHSDILIRIDDKTELEKKGEQLLQAQKMETVGTLAGGLAHDFNNVLSAITGTISLMKYLDKKKKGNEARFNDYINVIHESAIRASDMVAQLLTLSRKHELSLTPVNLNDSVKHIVKMAKNTFDKSIEISAKYYEEKAMVFADPTQVEQALLNICVNAAHAMTIMKKKGETIGGDLKIEIMKTIPDKYFVASHPDVKANQQYFLIKISDTGIGISKENISKIFDPFFTTKEHGKGTGLGLAMTYNIFKELNGIIDIYSENKEGTTFNLFLPELKDKSIKQKQSKKRNCIKKGKGLVLIIDDEKLVRETAKNILQECGYSVIIAENGRKGLDIFSERYKEIDLVLLDMVMPKMSGKDTYKKLREINPEVKVILASGFKQDTRIKEAMELGVKYFIQKPFSLDDLSEKVYKVI